MADWYTVEMSQDKKKARSEFRQNVFQRDRYCCRSCGYQSCEEKAVEELDAHHIIDRHEMPNGGYVKENGISLCKIGENCHLKAEQGVPDATTLFWLIGSSEQKARIASERL